MGALLSFIAAPLAIVLAKMLGSQSRAARAAVEAPTRAKERWRQTS
jgi:hypothetical protein